MTDRQSELNISEMERRRRKRRRRRREIFEGK